MPLDRNAFKQGLKALLEDMATRESNPAQASEDYAEGLTRLIEALIKTATPTGTVITTGSATTQTGTLTNGTLT